MRGWSERPKVGVEWRGKDDPPEAQDGDHWIEPDGTHWVMVDCQWLSVVDGRERKAAE